MHECLLLCCVAPVLCSRVMGVCAVCDVCHRVALVCRSASRFTQGSGLLSRMAGSTSSQVSALPAFMFSSSRCSCALPLESAALHCCIAITEHTALSRVLRNAITRVVQAFCHGLRGQVARAFFTAGGLREAVSRRI